MIAETRSYIFRWRSGFRQRRVCLKVMLHDPIFNADFQRNVVALKVASCNRVHRAIFNATFCCGNMLQVFESDSKTCNIVALILLVLVRLTPSLLTFNATSPQNAPRRTKNRSRQREVNKQDGGACWRWRTGRNNYTWGSIRWCRKVIQFYEKKPVLSFHIVH